MIDFVLDRELVNLGKRFGFEKIYFVDLIEAKDANELKRKTSKNDGLVAVRANKPLLRGIFESKKVDIVVGLECIEDKDDLHYRKSGLDQVLCSLADKHRISIGFSFDELLNAKDKGKMIGRMMQNAVLCKKYKVNVVVASFSKDKYGLRIAKDLEAFGRVIGIDKFDNTKVFKLKDNVDIKVIE
ncbi:hypothetical protein HYV89_03840 [Candidatus Woesearchaeota archaeon]|nr:hypothetical protein [Candidatus Woesearchaeota archaeon]